MASDLHTPAAGSEKREGIILYCAADLLWATRIKETANAMGIPARPVRNMDMLKARLADSTVAGLIVDLDVPEGVELIRHVRGSGGAGEASAASGSTSTCPIVAFGPHVAVDLLNAAAAAAASGVGGPSSVLVRGAFSKMLPEVLGQMAGGSPG